MNEFDSIKWAQQQLDNTEFRLRNFKYNQTQINQYARNPYSEAEDNPPPFHVTLREDITIVLGDPVSEYKVTVAEGYIVEKNRYRTSGEAVVYHYCDNFFEAGDPKEFPITLQEAIFVTFTENSDGIIDTDSAELQVLDKDTKPIVDNRFHYKLAELEEVDGEIQVKPFLAGSHIYHTEIAVPPFYVFLNSQTEIPEGETEPVTTYTVDVNEGYVVERILQFSVDGLTHHACSALVDKPITIGQMVVVHVKSDATGKVFSAVIKVVDGSTTSIGASPANSGDFYYKLAELQAGGVLVPIAMGSHVYHPTGLSKDVRFMSCTYYDNSTPPVALNIPTQLGRFTFVSGMLVGVNLTAAQWNPAGATVIEVRSCSSEDAGSMP